MNSHIPSILNFIGSTFCFVLLVPKNPLYIIPAVLLLIAGVFFEIGIKKKTTKETKGNEK